MTKFDFTPAPWIWNGMSCVSNAERCLFSATQFMLDDPRVKQDYADARLISAAPDMIYALITAYRHITAIASLSDWHNESFRYDIQSMADAIEKASGVSVDEAVYGGNENEQ